MATYRIRVFTVPRQVPNGAPSPKPAEVAQLSVDCAGGVEEVRKAAQAKLSAQGYTPRSLSFTTDGGLVAVCHGAP